MRQPRRGETHRAQPQHAEALARDNHGRQPSDGWAPRAGPIMGGARVRIGAFVPRPESRDRLGRFMRVTVAGETRRNGWQLAEAAAETSPHGMQRLVASTAWDVDETGVLK